MQNMNIWISAPPPNYRLSGAPGHVYSQFMLSINDEFSMNYHIFHFEPIRFLDLEYKRQNMGFRAGSQFPWEPLRRLGKAG
jgi:hypothetical protein